MYLRPATAENKDAGRHGKWTTSVLGQAGMSGFGLHTWYMGTNVNDGVEEEGKALPFSSPVRILLLMRPMNHRSSSTTWKYGYFSHSILLLFRQTIELFARTPLLTFNKPDETSLMTAELLSNCPTGRHLLTLGPMVPSVFATTRMGLYLSLVINPFHAPTTIQSPAALWLHAATSVYLPTHHLYTLTVH